MAKIVMVCVIIILRFQEQFRCLASSSIKYKVWKDEGHLLSSHYRALWPTFEFTVQLEQHLSNRNPTRTTFNMLRPGKAIAEMVKYGP